MERRTVIVILVVVGAMSVVAAWQAGNPLRRSEAEIRNRILGATPLETPFRDVRDIVERNGWSIGSESQEEGAFDQRSLQPRKVGERHIWALLGHYGLPFPTYVSARWAFDENGRLIDVWVEKTIDAP